MKKHRKDKDFVKSPYFEGGRTAMDAYVKKVLNYPKEALASKIEGRVSIRYTVDYKGKVIEANIISGIGHGCDEEALRIVRSMTFKLPEVGKIKSKYSRQVHIHFRLPGSPTITPPTKNVDHEIHEMQFQYQVTSKTTTSPIKKTPPTTSYQITLQLPNQIKD